MNLNTEELFASSPTAVGILCVRGCSGLSRSAGGGMWTKLPFWRMLFFTVRSLLLLSAQLESRGGGGGQPAFLDPSPCLWTTKVPSLQRQMLSVLPLWFRLQSKQETPRLTNRAPDSTCTNTVLLKCTTALSPGKWKVIQFIQPQRAACFPPRPHLSAPSYLGLQSAPMKSEHKRMNEIIVEADSGTKTSRVWSYSHNKGGESSHTGGG